MKAFTDSILNAVKMMKLALENGRQIMGNGENIDYQYFLRFQQY